MKLNNKGFTLVELVVSFSFVVVVLISMFAIVINYQNEVDKESAQSNILVFRNSMLEIIYQDIVKDNTDSITSCGDKCALINTVSKGSYKLELITENNTEYLVYRNIKYMVPDSDNNLVSIDKFIFNSDLINKIYKVTIPIIHAELDDHENTDNQIEIIVSGKKLNLS